MSNAKDVNVTDAAPTTDLPMAAPTTDMPDNGKDTVVVHSSAGEEKKTVKQMLLCPATQNGRVVRQKTTPQEQTVVVCPGTAKEKTVTALNGKSEAENIKWVVVTEQKGNGTKQYICVRCGHEFVGKVGRVINHCLREGTDVAKCTMLPTDEQLTVLSRVRAANAAGSSAIVKASGTTSAPSVKKVFSTPAQKNAHVDEALAKFICARPLVDGLLI